ncbi:DUF3016 domain-containing protein [Ensifer sp. 4252]|uniref:DUF3016 domain-containing protein n=1 Tax=Ensifer sp. 4252 TaxID=3373915 RepID=UPI003D224914
MRTGKYIALTITVFLLAAAGAHAALTVTFVNPEHYRDDDFRSASKRKSIIAELTRYFATLDQRYLKEGQRLHIEVLDARLAGHYEPWRATFNDVRILRDTTPPRFKLRYTLRQAGEVLMKGEETVTDMNYLWSPNARGSSERLAYEKDMLRDWFRERFIKLKAPKA